MSKAQKTSVKIIQLFQLIGKKNIFVSWKLLENVPLRSHT